MNEFAPYMRWSKQHDPARYDLSGSNLLACTIEDLPGAREALDIAGLNAYGYPPLLDAIAQRYGSTPDRVAPASGAGGANFLALSALLSHGDEVLVERPAYDPLLGALRFLGARINRFDRRFEDGWRIDPERVRAALTPATRLVVVTNPHNPSGVLDTPDALAAIGHAAHEVGAHVLVDEAYLDIATPGPVRPAATLSDSFVSTSSLTKSYGLSGLRAGWILASPDVADRARRVRDIMDGIGPIPSDILAVLAFRHLDRLAERARAIVEPNRTEFLDLLAAYPELECVRPDATVAFPRLRDEADATAFVDRLRADHDTQLAAGSFFEAPAHFRIAFAGDATTLRGGLVGLSAALDARAGRAETGEHR